jgi:hypothetical protein
MFLAMSLALLCLSLGSRSIAQTVLFSDDLDDNAAGWQF